MNKKILFFIIFIIIISFIGNLARKTYIIYKYDKQMKEYSQITNFHQKYKICNNIEIETWRKDNISLYKRSSEDGTRLIYKDYNHFVNSIITDENINEVADSFQKDCFIISWQISSNNDDLSIYERFLHVINMFDEKKRTYLKELKIEKNIG